jgi:itaconyl-CoA hydratase
MTNDTTPRAPIADRGRYFEDYAVGDAFAHHPSRTVTQADNSWFTLLTMNTHPIHFDVEYARKTEFGKPIVCSPLTLAIVVGMSVRDMSQRAVANLGWTEINMTAPVFAGDTLSARSEVIALRPSGSRPGQGVMTMRTVGFNQHGTVVCEFIRTILLWRRGHDPSEA